ncbi:MAG: nitroreductase/quinone reductase family protein [Gammaproteobacteria bacterium]
MTKRDAETDLPEAVRQTIAEHHELYLRDPEAAHLWDPIVIGVPGGPVPCLLLWHTGRRSGRRLNSVLQYYRRGDEFAIVASKGGTAHHPAWYHNLVAEPRCEVWIGGFKTPAVARTMGAAERARWWPGITAEQPQQLEYEQRTSREIPVVMLELERTPV